MSFVVVAPPRRLPAVGLSEAFYQRRIEQAELDGDPVMRSAWKVAMYLTRAQGARYGWEEKLRLYEHCLLRHCKPRGSDEAAREFRQQLAHMVRLHAGSEALHLACEADEQFATRLSMGQSRVIIDDDAEQFFGTIIGRTETHDTKPSYFNHAEWQQLKMLRDHWV